MRYMPIGLTEDGSVSVRMFMDDGRTYDEQFVIFVPTLEELLDTEVAARMNVLAVTPPTQAELDDPAVSIGEVEGVTAIPDGAVPVVAES